MAVATHKPQWALLGEGATVPQRYDQMVVSGVAKLTDAETCESSLEGTMENTFCSSTSPNAV